MRGEASTPSAHECAVLDATELQAGCRLACQLQVRGDLLIDVPPESVGTDERLQLESDSDLTEIALPGASPPIRAVDVCVPRPHLGDLRSDLDRLRQACAEQGVGVGPIAQPVIADLPGALRAQNWTARLAIGDDGLVGVLPPKSALFGLAVDVGTTKLAAYLVDLESGRTVACEGVINPQVTYGEDVISRIAYADRTAGGGQTLHDVLAQSLNAITGRLCGAVGVQTQAVVDAVLVGNTAMHHLACGFPVAHLGRAPYVPAVAEALTLAAREVGLHVAPGAHVYLPPNIAGYVGADHVAVLLAVGPPPGGRTRLVIDIGTNTEISVMTDERIVSSSCASGPAFEGAHVGCGMRAVAGAIERVRVIAGEVRCQTIGGKAAIGICGSGILDAVAALWPKVRWIATADSGAITRSSASEATIGCWCLRRPP